MKRTILFNEIDEPCNGKDAHSKMIENGLRTSSSSSTGVRNWGVKHTIREIIYLLQCKQKEMLVKGEYLQTRGLPILILLNRKMFQS